MNSTCIHIQICMHTKSIRVHLHTVISRGAYLSISNGNRFHDINIKRPNKRTLLVVASRSANLKQEGLV